MTFRSDKFKDKLVLSDSVDSIGIELLFGDVSFYPEISGNIKDQARKEKFGDEDEFIFYKSEIHESDVVEFINVWYSLSEDEAMRCFMPGYRVVFYVGDKVIGWQIFVGHAT